MYVHATNIAQDERRPHVPKRAQIDFSTQVFSRCIEDLGLINSVFILIGVGPLKSVRAAERMRSKLPGVHIQDTINPRMNGAADPLTEGRRICVDLIQKKREIKGVAGVNVVAYRQEEAVAEIIQKSGDLAGRQPWYPSLKPAD